MIIQNTLIDIAYLLGAVSFVWGLRLLSSPDSARRGNIYAAVGMILGIIAVLLDPRIVGPEGNFGGNFAWIGAGIVGGTVIGWLAAKKIQMTAMPQMVSIFNGLGGACAAILSVVELFTQDLDTGGKIISLFALLIGAVAFTGSLLAYLKLDGKLKDKHVTLPKHNIINQILLLAVIALFVLVAVQSSSTGLIIGFIILALVYGWSFVAPIGGADMPVVISLLNSFTGLSAAAAGLIYGSNFMLVAVSYTHLTLPTKA